MIERKGDLWEMYPHPGHRIAISTNGFVMKNGEAVLGRGCAKQAKELFPKLPKLLGEHIKLNGNLPTFITVGENAITERLMILPVKHNWWERADLTLVNNSVIFLKQSALGWKDWTFHVPRLGCGNGKLSWEKDVRPIMYGLPDNVVVHS